MQPLRAHEHWHVDISYFNIAGTFYYLCAILDGATRFSTAIWIARDQKMEPARAQRRAHCHSP